MPRPTRTLIAVAGIVAALDLSTKLMAVLALGADDVVLSRVFRLAVVHHSEMPWDLGIGATALMISATATLVLFTLVARSHLELTTMDSRAPLALGAIVGSGIANLVDGLVPPRGVIDFLAVQYTAGAELVFNVADVALLVGLVMSARIAARLVGALRRPELRRIAPVYDIEVMLPLSIEGATMRRAEDAVVERPISEPIRRHLDGARDRAD